MSTFLQQAMQQAFKEICMSSAQLAMRLQREAGYAKTWREFGDANIRRQAKHDEQKVRRAKGIESIWRAER